MIVPFAAGTFQTDRSAVARAAGGGVNLFFGGRTTVVTVEVRVGV